jgi:D-3-phosphoglycerate dehydrogenase
MAKPKPKILVSNLMMLKERDRFDAELKSMGAEPVWADVGQFLDSQQCMKYAGSVDAWSAGDDQISREVLNAYLPRLRGIAKWGTGIDSIDLVAAKELNVPVYNTPGAFSEAVAEVALGYMLILTRQLNEVDSGVRNGEWLKPKGTGLFNRVLGQIGFGAIGQGIARRAQGCGMSVLAYDPPMAHVQTHAGAEFVELNDLLKKSDIVCLACNFTEDNKHLINADTLSQMKNSAVLINVARGAIVDTNALISALKSNEIFGAGLDVFEEEPLPLTSELVKLPRVVLGSHNANNLDSAVEAVHANTMKNLSNLISPLL